jgi:hypothetical protein
MNVVARHVVRTGTHEADQQGLAQWQAWAAAQGLTMYATPLPQGGFQVDLVAAAAPGMPAAPTAYAAPASAALVNPYAPPHAQGVAQMAPACCQGCGHPKPTKHLTFRQNIGLVVLRIPSTAEGYFGRSCASSYFWRMTGISALFGWWGVISFFYTLVTIPANVAQYVSSRGLPEE